MLAYAYHHNVEFTSLAVTSCPSWLDMHSTIVVKIVPGSLEIEL